MSDPSSTTRNLKFEPEPPMMNRTSNPMADETNPVIERVARALARFMDGDDAHWEEYTPEAQAALEAMPDVVGPVPMILFCPRCGLQHVDEPDERTPDWTNPPHRSHLCHDCGCIWRPADVPTNGVRHIQTSGKADNYPMMTVEVGYAAIAGPDVVGLREALEEAQRTLTVLANWRQGSAEFTDRHDIPRRRMDESQVIHMESEAGRALREIDAALAKVSGVSE